MLTYLWVAPLTLVGLAAALVARATGGVARRRTGVLEAHGGVLRTLLPRCGVGVRPEAMALGHVLIAIDGEALDRHRDHEWVHVRQAERWGPLFPLAYLAGVCLALVRRQHPYRDNPFEREARGA